MGEREESFNFILDNKKQGGKNQTKKSYETGLFHKSSFKSCLFSPLRSCPLTRRLKASLFPFSLMPKEALNSFFTILLTLKQNPNFRAATAADATLMIMTQPHTKTESVGGGGRGKKIHEFLLAWHI